MSNVTADDCQACGACCIGCYDDSQYVELLQEDVDRLSVYYQRTKVIRETLPPAIATAEERYRYALATKKQPQTGDCVCVALVGAPGLTKVRCSIYARRPSVCREFKPGSQECLEARSEIAHRLEV